MQSWSNRGQLNSSGGGHGVHEYFCFRILQGPLLMMNFRPKDFAAENRI